MTTSQPFILAVDGGGTKTTAWIAQQDGTVLGKATTGAMSLAATSPERAVENFLLAIELASEHLEDINFSHVVIGLAGVDTHEELQRADELFKTALAEKFAVDSCEVVNDTVIALASGTQSKNAIVLISGTGSNCFGHNEAGQTAKTGGMDYLLSDQGSGFEIGQMVLRAAIKSFDGRSAKSILEKLVCDHFKIDSAEQLKNKVYHPMLNKTQIGELGKMCFIARELQDTIANEIIVHALNELIEMVITVLKRLQLSDIETDLVLIGGIATDPYTKSQLDIRLHANYKKLNLIVPTHPPVYGALQLALQK